MSKNDLIHLVALVLLSAFFLGAGTVLYVVMFFKQGFLNVGLLPVAASFVIGYFGDKHYKKCQMMLAD